MSKAVWVGDCDLCGSPNFRSENWVLKQAGGHLSYRCSKCGRFFIGGHRV